MSSPTKCLQAGAGNIISGDFVHLAKIIDSITDKSRVGVCLDTYSSFALAFKYCLITLFRPCIRHCTSPFSDYRTDHEFSY